MNRGSDSSANEGRPSKMNEQTEGDLQASGSGHFRSESDDEYVSPQSNTAASRHSYKEAMNTPLSTTEAGVTSGSGFMDMPASSTCIEGVSPTAIYNEERMRRKLQFFFMNPIEKWQARRKFPYKFVVQVNLYTIYCAGECL